MPTNKQRREAARRHLERQLQSRQAREARRRKQTLIISIVATIVLIGAIVGVIVATTGGSDKSTKSKAGANSSTSSSASTSPSVSASSSAAAVGTPTSCKTLGKGKQASFAGVTVTNPRDLKHAPVVKSTSTTAPKALECMDLVAGKGKAATPTSTVSVQYSGVLYKNGTAFDSSWKNGGKPVQFSLTGVVPGFTQGIGGVGKVAPMKVGGRRIIIMPAALGYGAQAQGTIPANSPLVFIVDLTSVSG